MEFLLTEYFHPFILEEPRKKKKKRPEINKAIDIHG
jgi:hypothetical protein